MLVATFWVNSDYLLIGCTILFIFTVLFEIYAVRKNDLKNQKNS